MIIKINKKISLVFGVLLIWFPLIAAAADYSRMELSDWNEKLGRSNWRVLISSAKSAAVGSYQLTPTITEIGAPLENMSKCGVQIVTRVRSRFPDPVVPPMIIISTARSWAMVPIIHDVVGSKADVQRIELSVSDVKWVRLETSDTTVTTRSSPIWRDPTLRARLIQCLAGKQDRSILESTIAANVVVAAKNKKGEPINLSGYLSELALKGSGFGLSGTTNASGNIEVKGVILARRIGLCVNGSIFFRNSDGSLGAERC